MFLVWRLFRKWFLLFFLLNKQFNRLFFFCFHIHFIVNIKGKKKTYWNSDQCKKNIFGWEITEEVKEKTKIKINLKTRFKNAHTSFRNYLVISPFIYLFIYLSIKWMFYMFKTDCQVFIFFPAVWIYFVDSTMVGKIPKLGK